MKEQIIPHPDNAEYFFEEGCYITELSNSSRDPEVSIARVRVVPGMTTRLHRLNGVTERYIIQEGEGEVELGGLKHGRVKPGDVVLITPGCSQRISNAGSGQLVFLAICSPRFIRDCYENIDA